MELLVYSLFFFCIVITSECQHNRDRPYVGIKDEDDEEALEDDDGARGGGRDSVGSGSSHRSSLDGDAEYAQKVHRLQTAKQKLRQLQELVAMVQVRVWGGSGHSSCKYSVNRAFFVNILLFFLDLLMLL